jgi:hypothetical protein
MPEISRFFGIVITMYYRDHSPAHFHARYGEYRAVVDILDGRVEGFLPPRALGMVEEWRRGHSEKLLENWRSALEGRPLSPIAGLDEP